MDADCARCGQLAAARRALESLAGKLTASADQSSPRYYDTKGTLEARARELDQAASEHQAEVHYLDLLVMCSDTLALMPRP